MRDWERLEDIFGFCSSEPTKPLQSLFWFIDDRDFHVSAESRDRAHQDFARAGLWDDDTLDCQKL